MPAYCVSTALCNATSGSNPRFTMHLRLLYMMSLLLLWFPPRGYSQTEAWAISGSFDKIATDDAGCLYTVSKNVLTKYDTLENALWSKTYAAPIECLTSGRDSARLTSPTTMAARTGCMGLLEPGRSRTDSTVRTRCRTTPGRSAVFQSGQCSCRCSCR